MHRATHLNKILAISALISLSIFLTPSYAKDIYKWVDKDGNIHFTDNRANIPEDKKGEANIIEKDESTDEKREFEPTNIVSHQPEEEAPETDLRNEREEALRAVWRGRALEIENKKGAILEEIEATKRALKEKKREVDSLLLNGYFADYSILELRYLNDHIVELENQLELIKQERANLEEEARQEGIPPGHIRP
jgi:hypothetical protein